VPNGDDPAPVTPSASDPDGNEPSQNGPVSYESPVGTPGATEGSSKNKSDGFGAGAIAGIAVGGLALVLISVGVLLFIRGTRVQRVSMPTYSNLEGDSMSSSASSL
jgi:Na+/H+-translocating membrane pyrophosphatase